MREVAVRARVLSGLVVVAAVLGGSPGVARAIHEPVPSHGGPKSFALTLLAPKPAVPSSEPQRVPQTASAWLSPGSSTATRPTSSDMYLSGQSPAASTPFRGTYE
jgi:hypothetical protein